MRLEITRTLQINDSSNVVKLELDPRQDRLIIYYQQGSIYEASATLKQFGELAGATSVGQYLASLKLKQTRIE